jgi:MFS family permease
MLALLCTGLLGSYYCYDNPSATQVAMEQYFGGNATSTEDDTSSSCSGDSSSSSDSGGTFTLYFNLLYSVYSWPNVILPFFGGYLSDKLGVRLMLVVFLLFITLGQVIFAFGASLKGMWAWYVMWIGRTVFGFGGESLSVAQSALIASWFAGKELAFALGLNLALARLGSVVNDVVSIAVANAYSAPYYAFWVGAGVCLLSLGAGLITYYLDQGSEDVLRKNQGKRPAVRTSLLASLLCIPACMGGRGGRRGDKEGSLLEEEELSRLVDEKLEEEGLQGEGEWEPEDPPEVIELSAATRFPLTFWLLCVSCVCTYACVLCFNNVAGSFFAQKWLSKDANGKYVPLNQLSAASLKDISSQANNLLLITYLVAAFLAPIFGGLIDWVGYRAVLTAFSSGLITVSFSSPV